MSGASVEKPQTRVSASSFADKNRNDWVDAQPADSAAHHRVNAALHTPNAEQNRAGPNAELKPDPAAVPSLVELAATLGIPILLGETLIDAQTREDADTNYDEPGFIDPSLLMDE